MRASFVLSRLLVIAALASVSMVPASAGIVGPTKGLPPVQTADVKVPLKLIYVGTSGNYGDPGEPPATEGCPECWDPPSGSEGDDPLEDDRPDDPPTP